MSLVKNARPFNRYLLSYVIIFLIPLAISLLLNRQVLTVVEEGERESSLSLLRKAKEEIDAQLVEIERFSVLKSEAKRS